MPEEIIPLTQAVLRYRPNWFLRLLGFRHKDRPGDYEFRWGTFNTKIFGLELMLIQFSNDHDYDHKWSLSFLFLWGRIFITLPIQTKGYEESDPGQNDIRHWGFWWYWRGADQDHSELVWQWRDYYKTIYMPWHLEFYEHRYLAKDGTWMSRLPRDNTQEQRDAFSAKVAYETYSFYHLKQSGEVQTVQATISVEEGEWRRRWWKNRTWFRLVRRCLEMNFNPGVGEHRGGTIGCSTELRYEETPHDALRRYQRTERFR